MKNINISFTEAEISTLNDMLLNDIAQFGPSIPDKNLQFYVNLHNKITGDILTIKDVRENIFKQSKVTSILKQREVDQYGFYVDPY